MKTTLIRRTAPTFAALLLTLPLGACSQDTGAVDTDNAVERTDQDPTEPEAGIDPATLSFEDISDDLHTLVGEEVMVTAKVERIVTPGVFLINSLEGNDLESIAVVEVDESEDIEVDSEVVLTATVDRTLDLEQRVKTLLDVQLDRETLADYERRLYLEAVEIHSADNVA